MNLAKFHDKEKRSASNNTNLNLVWASSLFPVLGTAQVALSHLLFPSILSSV